MQETELLKLVASDDFLNAAKEHVEQKGFASPPFNLIQSLLAPPRRGATDELAPN